jgi:hypothetical protein
MPRPKMDCSWRMGLCSVPCRADLFCRATLDKGGAKSRLSITRPPSFTFSCFCFNQLLCSDSCVGTGLCPVRRWIVLGGWDRAPCRVGPIFSVELRSTWAGQSPAPMGVTQSSGLQIFQHFLCVPLSLDVFEYVRDAAIRPNYERSSGYPLQFLSVHVFLFDHTEGFAHFLIGVGQQGIGEIVLILKLFLALWRIG